MTLAALLQQTAIRYHQAARECLKDCPQGCSSPCEACIVLKIRATTATITAAEKAPV